VAAPARAADLVPLVESWKPDLLVHDETEFAGAVAAAVAVIGLLSLVGGRIAVPSLDVSDPAQLIMSYRSRFFARLAWAEAPALLAFAGFLLLGGEAWVNGIGLAASLAGFALAAPTRASVRREQQQIAASGTSLDLLEVLSGC
nr:hypothetical protein [Actinomycetota bacterium]